MSDAFSLSFNPLGELVVRFADNTQHAKAVVVRAFPIAEPRYDPSLHSTWLFLSPVQKASLTF